MIRTHPGQTPAEAALGQAGTMLTFCLALQMPTAAQAIIMMERQEVVTPTCKPQLLCSTDGHACGHASMFEEGAFPQTCMLGSTVYAIL